MTITEIRRQFPALERTVYGKPLVYFDNAATVQRPRSVLQKWVELSEQSNANIHRAVHKLAVDATEEYESTRDVVRDFIGASSREEIIFTSGTTASVNLVAFSFGEAFVKEGDEIIVSEAEHHSNILPWQMLCERKHASLKVLPIDDEGHWRLDALEPILGNKVKIVAISQISNVLGIVNPVRDLITICHRHDIPVFVDGAQGIVHEGMNVTETDCDFYAFSGHKLYAAPGTGVLYGKKKWLDQMPPYMGGGEMIETVRFSGSTYAPVPGKFEAGTQNLAGTPTLKPAIEIAKQLKDNELERCLSETGDYLMDALSQRPGIKLFGVPRGTEKKIPLFSFAVQGVHHEDLALLLDKMGIAVRSGQMCAEPLMDRFGVTGMLRASLVGYNTLAEAEQFIKALDRAIAMLS